MSAGIQLPLQIDSTTIKPVHWHCRWELRISSPLFETRRLSPISTDSCRQLCHHLPFVFFSSVYSRRHKHHTFIPSHDYLKKQYSLLTSFSWTTSTVLESFSLLMNGYWLVPCRGMRAKWMSSRPFGQIKIVHHCESIQIIYVSFIQLTWPMNPYHCLPSIMKNVLYGSKTMLVINNYSIIIRIIWYIYKTHVGMTLVVWHHHSSTCRVIYGGTATSKSPRNTYPDCFRYYRVN